MDVLLGLLIAVVAVVAVVGMVGYLASRTVVRHNAARAATTLPPRQPGDLEESAAMLEPERGFGMLRLTDRELIFANGNTGTVTRFDRTDLAVVRPSHETPGAGSALRRPALVVATASGAGMAVAVSDVSRWLASLTDPPHLG